MVEPHPDTALCTLPTRDGTLLGGRVRHTQPLVGHRTGLEPVLLAASIPARPGQRVLEVGTGAGAALLCLAARVPGLAGTGIERDPGMAGLARANAAANGFTGLEIVTADIATWQPGCRYDHAMANPPWHDSAASASPDTLRDAARRATPGLFAAWATRLAASLRPRGTLSLALGAGHLAAGIAALSAAGCGSIAVFPLWPKAGRAAKLVLLRGVRGGRGPTRLMAGLVLHADDGTFTAPADAVLRDAGALAF